MVYYFTSNVVDPPATIYVGKDKFESLLFLFSFLFSFLVPSHLMLVWSGFDSVDGGKKRLPAEIFVIYLF